jgi:hypothetical protein
VYLHRQCGSLTEISGHNFLRLANPFAVVSETICSGCGKAVPIRQVEWADTGENIAAYRRRLRSAMPLGRRLFFLSLGFVSGAVVGFLCGFAGGLLMIGPVGNRPWWLQESGLIGGGVGAFAGSMLGSQLLPAPLMRMLWGLDYRGEP